MRGARRAAGAIVVASCLVGCGGRHALTFFERKPTAYGAVEACLTQQPLAGDSSGQDYAGVPPRPDRLAPRFVYRRATGGWMLLRSSRASFALILFYPSTEAAARMGRRLTRRVGGVAVDGSRVLLRHGSLGGVEDRQLVRCFRE